MVHSSNIYQPINGVTWAFQYFNCHFFPNSFAVKITHIKLSKACTRSNGYTWLEIVLLTNGLLYVRWREHWVLWLLFYCLSMIWSWGFIWCIFETRYCSLSWIEDFYWLGLGTVRKKKLLFFMHLFYLSLMATKQMKKRKDWKNHIMLDAYLLSELKR